MWKIGATLLLVLTTTGCATLVAVKPVAWSPDSGRRVCVKENPVLIDPDLLPAIEAALTRNGLSWQTYPGPDNQEDHPQILAPPEEIPAGCDYVLTYVGFVHWDLAVYLWRAEFSVQDRAYQQVGTASFELEGGGGLRLSKFAATDEKVGPVLDQMLTGVAPRKS